jgi:hypothetical protein
MKKLITILSLLVLLQPLINAQRIVRTSDLFGGSGFASESGYLTIIQHPAIDTLISRHIEANSAAGGIDGYRIQIFRKGGQAAREEADKVMARAIEQFPDIKAYRTFQGPNFWLVRMGDFRTKIEATKAHASVRRAFPDSYLVRETVNFTDIISK